MAARQPAQTARRWRRRCREAFAELADVFARARAHYRDMQDIEFTVQHGKLFMLQTRSGKRTAQAALKIAVDMAARRADHRGGGGAARRSRPRSTSCCTRRSIPRPRARSIAKGLPASPGAVVRQGRVHRRSMPSRWRPPGETVILVRIETSPEDIHGMHAAKGILTVARRHDQPRGGGRARHGQALRLPAPATLSISDAENAVTVKGGARSTRGRCHHPRRRARARSCWARSPTVEPELSDDFATLMDWADARAAAEGAHQRRHAARRAHRARVRRRGHRPVPHRAHVLRARAHRRHARDDPGRRRRGRGARRWPRSCRCSAATSSSSSEIMAGLPVTIRLLDPPLHEFLPHDDDELAAVAKAAGVDVRRWSRRRAAELKESQPDARPCAAAGSASCFPRSTRCRRARSSRRRRRSRPQPGSDGGARDHDPAGRLRASSMLIKQPDRRAWRPRSRKERGDALALPWSAP